MLSVVFKALVAFAPVALAVQRKTLGTEEDDVVGTASTFIDGSKERCRNAQCGYGTLLCDAMKSYGKRQGKGTHIALYNAGGIRGSLMKGPVTKEDLLKIHPYGNNVWFFKLKGDVIKEALRMSLKEHDAPNHGEAGSWWQMSGLRFKAAWNGTKWRLSNVTVNTEGSTREDLKEDKTYNVVSNTYIVEGNGDRNIIKNGIRGDPEKDAMTVADLMINYFKVNSPVATPEDDGRQTLIIAETKGEIDGRPGFCRDRACPYGILLTEEMLRYGKRNGHGTQIALYNSGGIRGSIPKGEIEDAVVRKVHPYGNNVEFLKVKGETIKKALVMSLKEHDGPAKGKNGSWFQIAGLKFKAKWGGDKKAWDLDDVQVKDDEDNWSDLFNDTTYKIATNTYIIDGNGGRGIIQHGIIGEVTHGETVASLMIDYFARNTPITVPEPDARELLIVGYASERIDGERERCRDRTCAYGILLTEALKEFGKKEGHATQIGLYNGGGIKGSIAKGPVTETSIFRVHPFGNNVFFAEILGETLQEEIEMALKEHKGPGKGEAGSWLQLTGMTFSAAWDGSAWSLSEIKINTQGDKWDDLQAKTIYKIALNTYIMDGNGGRNIIKNNVLSFTRSDTTIAELMLDHFAKHSPISAPKDDHRVKLE